MDASDDVSWLLQWETMSQQRNFLVNSAETGVRIGKCEDKTEKGKVGRMKCKQRENCKDNYSRSEKNLSWTNKQSE